MPENPDTNFSLEDELVVELSDMLENLEAEVRPKAESAIRYIGHWTQVGIATGDHVRAQRNIQYELSSLASLASISVTAAQAAVADAIERVLNRALTMLLAAV